MKQLFIFIIGFVISTVGYSQDIISALKNGNAKELAAYFDNSVEIKIGEQISSANKKKEKNYFEISLVKQK